MKRESPANRSIGSTHEQEDHIGSKRLRLFRLLFVARTDAYAISDGERIVAVRKRLSDEVLAAHLAGEYRVGTYLVERNGRTPFLVFDVDSPKRKIVRKILKRLRRMNVSAYVEKSKSRGFHIWVFFDKPLRAAKARAFARLVLRGLEDSKIEIFPKQDKVTGDGLGNCIWLPLFGPYAAKGRTIFVDREFATVEKQWSFVQGIRRVPRRTVINACKHAKRSPIFRFPRTNRRAKSSAPALANCAQSILLKGVEEDHRNTALFTLAKHLRNAGLERSHVEDLVRSANERCNPPLDEQEITSITKSVFSHEYTSLGCEDPFVASLCGDRCPVKRARRASAGASVEAVLAKAEAKPTIHPSQAFHEGILWYGLKLGQERLWINSERKAFTVDQMRKSFTLPKLPMKSRWSLASINTFIRERKRVKPDVLFVNLRGFISRRIRFLAPWQPTLVTLWLMGTYVHRIFDWYGYTWLTSPSRRTGKTRLLEIISTFAYNATPVMTDPTEASLFRETAINASVQVLDEIESLRGADQEKRAALMSLLNVGFKAGSTVPRYNNNSGRIEYHDAYCPRVLAGISRLAPTLADRSFRIFLKRKMKEEKVARFSERKLSAYLQKKRDNLHCFGLLFAGAIAKQYAKADSFCIPKEADDRARDILEPLFAIAIVLDEKNSKLRVTKQLIQAAERIAKDRAADEGEDEEVVATLEVLAREFPKASERWILTSSAARSVLQKHDALEWVEERRQAARLLRQLGFRSATHRTAGRVIRAYAIARHKLVDLCQRYGVALPKGRRRSVT